MQATRIRAVRRKDINLLTHSWLSSFRHGGLFNRAVPNSLYYYHHHKVITKLLHEGMVLVTVDREDPDHIVGWLCAQLYDSALVIHYGYVKQSFRRMGVFRQMVQVLQEKFQPPAVMYTHRTQAGGRIADRNGWIYNPYLLWHALPDTWEQMQIKATQVERNHDPSPSSDDSPSSGRIEGLQGAVEPDPPGPRQDHGDPGGDLCPHGQRLHLCPMVECSLCRVR